MNNIYPLRRWTDKEDALLELAFRNGQKEHQIAKALGRRDVEVFKRLRERGLNHDQKNLKGA